MHRWRAESLLNAAIRGLQREPLAPSLYDGYAGIGWLAAHFTRLFDRADDEAFAEVDSALTSLATQSSRPIQYDLISGLVGIGVYFLERLPHPRARNGLRCVATALESLAICDDHGARWLTPPQLLGPSQRPIAPSGLYNLGVAHGAAGIIGVLGQMRRAALRRPFLRVTAHFFENLLQSGGDSGASSLERDQAREQAVPHVSSNVMERPHNPPACRVNGANPSTAQGPGLPGNDRRSRE